MISGASIWAIVLRHTRVWKRDLNLILAGFIGCCLTLLFGAFWGPGFSSPSRYSFTTMKLLRCSGFCYGRLWEEGAT